MLARLGSSLVLLGVIGLVVFLVTASAGQAVAPALLLGASLAALGLLLRRLGRPRRAPPARFRLVRRLLGRAEEEGEEG